VIESEVDAADSTNTPSIVQFVDNSPPLSSQEDGVVSADGEDSLVRLVESPPVKLTEPPTDTTASARLQLLLACWTCDMDSDSRDTEPAICAYYPRPTGRQASGADVSITSDDVLQSVVDLTSVSSSSQSDTELEAQATASIADEPSAASAGSSTSISSSAADELLADETVVMTMTGASQPVMLGDSVDNNTVSADSESLQSAADVGTLTNQLSLTGKFTYSYLIHYHRLSQGKSWLNIL